MLIKKEDNLYVYKRPDNSKFRLTRNINNQWKPVQVGDVVSLDFDGLRYEVLTITETEVTLKLISMVSKHD